MIIWSFETTIVCDFVLCCVLVFCVCVYMFREGEIMGLWRDGHDLSGLFVANVNLFWRHL